MEGEYDQNTLCIHVKMSGHAVKPIMIHSYYMLGKIKWEFSIDLTNNFNQPFCGR